MIFTSGNYMDAQLVASVLGGSGIAAYVIDDNVCRMYPQAMLLIGGAKVLVRAEELDSAREVLSAVNDGEAPIAGNFLSIPLSEPAAIITAFRKWLKRNKNP